MIRCPGANLDSPDLDTGLLDTVMDNIRGMSAGVQVAHFSAQLYIFIQLYCVSSRLLLRNKRAFGVSDNVKK